MLSVENGSDVILPNAKDIDYRDGGAAAAVSSEESEKCESKLESRASMTLDFPTYECACSAENLFLVWERVLKVRLSCRDGVRLHFYGFPL